MGQQVGGIWAERLTEGRAGRVEARSGPGHGFLLKNKKNIEYRAT